jgi:hypothetical protein
VGGDWTCDAVLYWAEVVKVVRERSWQALDESEYLVLVANN